MTVILKPHSDRQQSRLEQTVQFDFVKHTFHKVETTFDKRPGGSVVWSGRWTCDFRSQVQFSAMTLPSYFGDRLLYFAGKLSWNITTTCSTQPCISLGSLNRVTASAGSKGGKSHHCQMAGNTACSLMACDFT